MSKLVTTTIQKPGGAAMTFPATDGTAGQFLTTDGTGNLSWGNSYQFLSTGGALVAPEGVGQVGSIISQSAKGNGNADWSSSGPWTTYTGYDSYTDNSLIQCMNMALGDGMGASGTSETWIGDCFNNISRQVHFSNGNRLGVARDQFYWDNNTSYGGYTWQIMPIRNFSGSAINVSIYGYVSDYWSSGYEGGCLFVLTPNTSTYSTVTTVSSTRLAYSQSNTRQVSLSGTISVPANTTVLAVLVGCHQYNTTYRFKDTNYFYNISTTFSNSNIKCDMRMLSSLWQSRFNLAYSGAAVGTGLLAPLWTKTATNYGDR